MGDGPGNLNELCQLTELHFSISLQGEWEGRIGGREEEKQLREEGGARQLQMSTLLYIIILYRDGLA